MWCHSSWEKQVAEALDHSDKVKIFFKDNIKIPYKFGGKDHLFFVDFQVIFKTGKTIMIEVKAEKLVKDDRTKAKLVVLYEFSKKQNYDVLILTGKNKLNINPLLRYLTF